MRTIIVAHRTDLLIALAVAVVVTAVLVVTAPDVGLTWDEPVYMAAAELHVQWLERLWRAPGYALSEQGVRAYWELNHEHPPLGKVWAGVVWAGARHVLDDLTAHRLGTMLLAGALAGALYLLVAGSFGAWAGLASAAALVALPRFFFHAHLAALDVPAAAAVFFVTALFWHARARRSAWWDVLLGLAWGAALATKINALLVIPALLAWAALFDRRPRLFVRLGAAALLGLPAFVALWPWLYYETWDRLVAYVRFITVDHWQIGQWYLGAWHMPPPWHFAPVMLVVVTPLPLLIVAVVGLARGVAGVVTDDGRQTTNHRPQMARPQFAVRRPWSAVVLWGVSGAVPLAALALGQTKVYDNERLFMPVFPFLAALAGTGLVWVVRAGLDRAARLPRAARAAGVAASLLLVPLTFVPPAIAGAALWPHLLSYYSGAVGGLPGAVRLGLETTYWCEVYAAALPAINERAPRGAVVWAEPWSHDVLLYYQLAGRLRGDLRVAVEPGGGSALAARGAEGVEARIGAADYVIVAYRETGLAVHPQIRAFAAGRTPIMRLERFGVPLLELYER